VVRDALIAPPAAGSRHPLIANPPDTAETRELLP